MTSELQFYVLLALLITAAKAAGWLSVRLKQPAVLGELLVGVLLGPSVIDLLGLRAFSDPVASHTLSQLAGLGVLMLMFVAGLEVDVATLKESSRVSLLAGSLGVLVPLLLAGGVGLAAGLSLGASVFLGLTLSATSVSISAQTLIELGVLRTRVGIGLLGAAVADDVLVIVLMAVTIAVSGGTGSGALGILWLLFRMVAFFAIVWLVGRWLLPAATSRVAGLGISEGTVAYAVVVALLLAWAAEYLGGVASITGAFVAGLLFGRTPSRGVIERGVHTISYAVLVPVFFVSIGLHADVRALGGLGAGLVIALCVVAVGSKVLGSGLGALWSGFSGRDSLRLGIGMVSRGEVGLIVASVGVSSGLGDKNLMPLIVIIVLVTTILTPVMLKALYARPDRARPPSPTRNTPPRAANAE